MIFYLAIILLFIVIFLQRYYILFTIYRYLPNKFQKKYLQQVVKFDDLINKPAFFLVGPAIDGYENEYINDHINLYVYDNIILLQIKDLEAVQYLMYQYRQQIQGILVTEYSGLVSDLVNKVYYYTKIQLSLLVCFIVPDFYMGIYPTITYLSLVNDLLDQWEKSIFNYIPSIYHLSLAKQYDYKQLSNLMEIPCKFSGIYWVDSQKIPALLIQLSNYTVKPAKFHYQILLQSLAFGLGVYGLYHTKNIIYGHRIMYNYYQHANQYISQGSIVNYVPYCTEVYGIYSKYLLYPLHMIIYNFTSKLHYAAGIPSIPNFDDKIFYHSIDNTIFFYQVNQYIDTLIKHAQHIQLPKDQAIFNEISNRFHETIDIIVEYYNKNALIDTLNQFKKSIEMVQKNHQIYHLRKSYELINQLDQLSRHPLWWRKNQGGFESVINKLKKHKNTKLFANILQDRIYSKIHDIENNLIYSSTDTHGKIFNLNKTLELTEYTIKLSKSLLKLYHHPLLQPTIAKNPDVNQIIIWDINKLQNLVKSQQNFKNILSIAEDFPRSMIYGVQRTLANGVFLNQYNQLLSCYIKADNIKINDLAHNIKSSSRILKSIDKFFSGDLANNCSFINQSLQHNSIYLANKVKEILNNGIFVSYKYLQNWQGNNIIEYLFQIKTDQLNEYLSEIQSRLSLLKHILQIAIENIDPDHELYYFSNYFLNQIKGINDPRNHLRQFLKFFEELQSWEITYREPIEISTNTKDFFLHHLNKYKYHLIQANNRVLLDRSINSYNHMRKLFAKIKHYTPFGIINKIKPKELLEFFQDLKTHLPIINTKIFKDQYPETTDLIESLKDLSDNIKIYDKKIYFNLNIKYHVDHQGREKINKQENSQYIIQYTTKINNETHLGDHIIDKPYDIFTNFYLLIDYVDPDKVMTQEKSTKKYDYGYGWGLVNFINNHFYQKINNDIILKINIPLEEQDIITYVKISNYPNFIKDMPELKSV